MKRNEKNDKDVSETTDTNVNHGNEQVNDNEVQRSEKEITSTSEKNKMNVNNLKDVSKTNDSALKVIKKPFRKKAAPRWGGNGHEIKTWRRRTLNLQPKRKEPTTANRSLIHQKQRRMSAGRNALREIRKAQKSTDLLISYAPFMRYVIKSILSSHAVS